MTTTVVAGVAIAAGAVVFVSIPTLILELASAWEKIRYARFPNSDEAFGWGELLSAPLLFALDLGVSIGIGTIVFCNMKDWR